jgi:hypothetical protein
MPMAFPGIISEVFVAGVGWDGCWRGSMCTPGDGRGSQPLRKVTEKCSTETGSQTDR